jgi:hypothetical protein
VPQYDLAHSVTVPVDDSGGRAETVSGVQESLSAGGLLDETGPLVQRRKAEELGNPDPSKNPATHIPVAPDGYHLRGVSTLVGSDGNVKQTWVKTAKDKEDRIQALRRALEYLPDKFAEAHEPTAGPEQSDDDLLCVYPIADPHIGRYAWADEAGESYDLEIAERVHVGAVDKLVSMAPAAKRALVVSLGDWFHADNSTNRTMRAGNALDVDTRWQQVLRVGLRTMRRCIDRALQKHEQVRVICEIGNHDDHSAIMLALAMEMFYRSDERVSVDTSPNPFHWFRFGACLIGVTHGGRIKPQQLVSIMAADRAEDWGETRHRHWYTGHVHHHTADEFPGCSVESLRTAASSDAQEHRAGYRSGHDLRVDVWHRERGPITRHIYGVGA